MYDQGLITTDEYEAAKVEQVKFRLIVEGDAYGYKDPRYDEYYGNNANQDDNSDQYDDNDTYEAYRWNEYEISQNWYVDAAIEQVIEDIGKAKGMTYSEAKADLYKGGY